MAAASSRKIIKLLDYQHNSLRNLIEAEKVPDGQFIRRWSWWRQLVDTFNQMNDCNFSPEQVHHYVMTLRKRGLGCTPRWEPMGDGCARMPGHTHTDLSAEDRAHLIEAYKALAVEMVEGSDSILVNTGHRKRLASMFAAASGHGINDRALIAMLIDLRKDGSLPKLGNAVKRTGPKTGFGDFDAAAAL